MTDHRLMEPPRVILNGLNTPDIPTSERQQVGPPGMPAQALQVLAMAQRTAEEHVRSAQRHAERVHAEAAAAADHLAREAEAHAQEVRREAAKVLADARETSDRAEQEADLHVEQAQREAAKILADARAQAEAVGARAEDNAEELRLSAQRRYDDIVGSLGARREGLQQQIEALERFDREYRARLSSFMQSQLRALWVDQPQVTGAPDPDASDLPDGTQYPQHGEAEHPGGLVLVGRHGPDREHDLDSGYDPADLDDD